jgi:hypothetical protein
MTDREMADFVQGINANTRVVLGLGGYSISEASKIAMFATVAEDANKDHKEIEKPIYDGIVHLEQLEHSLSSTIELLHGYGCDSLSDVTGYRIDNNQLLFRVKGRVATAPVNYPHENIDLINYVRFYLGLSPLVRE